MPTDAPSLLPFLGGTCLVLFLLVLFLAGRVRRLAEELEDERSRQKSLSATYGRISEQWLPFSPAYPYDPQNFRFLGSPVDGVQFEEDAVIIVEFKANKSRLSEKQRHIKRLVEEGQVYWEEFHLTDEESDR